MNKFIYYLQQELLRRFKRPVGMWLPASFSLIVLSIAPLAIAPNEPSLQLVAPAFIWIALLLSSVMSFSALFEKNYTQGVIEQHILLPLTLEWQLLAQTFAHWISTIIPLIFCISITFTLYYISVGYSLYLMLMLCIGSGILVSLGMTVSALIVGASRAGAMVGILLLPLYLPVIIFCSLAAQKQGASAELWLMCGTLLITVPLSCWLSAALLRRSVT